MPFTAETLFKTADIPEKIANEIPRVINRLLGQTFLYQDQENDKEDYYLVFRYRDIFAALFNAIGFALIHDDYHRIFQVVSDFSYCRKRYPLDESLMIVVLRKLYEDQSEQLSLAKDPVVTVGEIREEYRAITGRERDLGVIQYETLMHRMRKLGLIEVIDGRSLDVRDGETRLRLRGSIKMLLPVQTAEEMEAWIRRYRRAAAGPLETADDDSDLNEEE
jgi:hypothetical protein